MAPEKMTDSELLENLRAGSEAAFRQLVESHKQKVINVCYRFAGSQEDADDLAQETFVEVHRSVAGFREEASLSTWIYRIAIAKSLDFIRKRDRKKRGGVLSKLLRLNDTDVELPAPASSGPDHQLENAERRRILQAALDELPKNQRVAFVLSKYDGLSYKEIAEILEVSLSSVESLIHRARKNLQRKLHKYYQNRL